MPKPAPSPTPTPAEHDTLRIGRGSNDRVPRWFLNLIVGCFSGCTGALLVVLVHIFNLVTSQVDAIEALHYLDLRVTQAEFKAHNDRLTALEIATPLELKQLREEVARTLRLVEAMAVKQGVATH